MCLCLCLHAPLLISLCVYLFVYLCSTSHSCVLVFVCMFEYIDVELLGFLLVSGWLLVSLFDGVYFIM